MEREPRTGDSQSVSIPMCSCQNTNPPLPSPIFAGDSLFFRVLAKTAILFNTSLGTSLWDELLPGVFGKAGDRLFLKDRAAQGGGVGTAFIQRTWFQTI